MLFDVVCKRVQHGLACSKGSSMYEYGCCALKDGVRESPTRGLREGERSSFNTDDQIHPRGSKVGV